MNSNWTDNERMDYPWVADQGDGTYRNPVLHADYSDPDVIRHGDDFWMVASSFTATPGLPILHSHDLVNWTIVNHAIRQVPNDRYRNVQPGCGVWAPSIRHHGGKFWVFFPMPDEGIYVTCADDPAGEWSKPWCLAKANGWIDPCPFWDEDGSAYLFHAYANSRAGIKDRIHMRPMKPDCTALLSDECHEIIHAPHHPYLEGPKVHKIDGWYYVSAPGGGVPQGWQVIFRSRNLLGPYEEKIVLEKGSTPINGPHQGALVDTPAGEWWFIHFQDAGAYGRIAHLQPVHWQDEWPLMGFDYDGNGVGEPVSAWKKPSVDTTAEIAVPATSDDFDAAQLGLQWQWQANHRDEWYTLTERPGFLRLFAQPANGSDLGRTPALMMQKFPARTFAVETLLNFKPQSDGVIAGVAVVGGGENAAMIIKGRRCELRINGELKDQVELSDGLVHLKVAVDESAKCTFSYKFENGDFIEISPSFEAREGGWIGAKVGIFCLSAEATESANHADFKYFRFQTIRKMYAGHPGPTQTTPGEGTGPTACGE